MASSEPDLPHAHTAEDPRSPSGGPASLILATAIGILGIAFIAFFTHWYEIHVSEMRGRQVIVNALAPIVFFVLFLLILLLNPLLHRFLPILAMRRREVLIILTMWLVTSAVTYRYLANPVLVTIGNTYHTGIQKPETRRIKYHDNYLKPDLFLNADEAKRYHEGISDGMTWIRPFRPSPRLKEDDFPRLQELASGLRGGQDPLSAYLQRRLPSDIRVLIDECLEAHNALRRTLVQRLNQVLRSEGLYSKERFENIVLTSRLESQIAERLQGDELPRLNRILIEKAMPRLFASRGREGPPDFQDQDLRSLDLLATRLREGRDPLSEHLRLHCLSENVPLLDRYLTAAHRLRAALAEGLNRLLRDPEFFGDPERYARVGRADEFQERFQANPTGKKLVALNRDLLAAAYPLQIARTPASIPWGVWLEPLKFWVPFMVVAFLLASSLVQVVHRQWSRHELLTYPIADFASSFLPEGGRRALPALFRDKVFWCGFIFISFIYLVNGLHLWFPRMVEIPLRYSHYSLIRQFPFLNKYCGREAYSLFRGMLYPFMACIAVLLPTEISFTCWFGWVLMILGTGVVFLTTGQVIGQTETGYIQGGMYVAMLAMIVFIGRREYLNILHHAVTFRRTTDRALRRAVWACRVFVLASAGMAALFVYAGADVFASLVVVSSFSLIVIITARMTAEIGIPWLVNFVGMTRGLPMKLLGAAALGPKSVAVIAVVAAVLDTGTANSVAAQETTYRKLGERPTRGLPYLLFNAVIILALLTAIGATIFSTLWSDYSFGGQRARRSYGPVSNNMKSAAIDISRLDTEGNLQASENASLFGKLGFVRLEMKVWWPYFLAGALVVVGCTLMRLRFTWWPLHPLPLLLLNTWCLSRMYLSFFVGWAIKVLLLKVGGGKVFTRSKPFFFGVIAGQIFMMGVWLAVGTIYHLKTGARPQILSFFY